MSKSDSFERYHAELNAKAAKASEFGTVQNSDTYKKMRAEVKALIKEKVNTTRRNFLDMTSKAGFSSALLKATPLLAGALTARQASAQTTARRVVYVYVPGGSRTGSWMPTGPSNMGRVTAAFEPVSQHCHFREINVELSGHASASQALGANYQGHHTIDVDIADVIGATAPFKSLFCGSSSTGQPFSSIGTPIESPHEALKNMFDDGLPSNGSVPPYQEAFNAQLNAIDELKNKLGSEELDRLNSHASAIQGLINRFETQSSFDTSALAALKPALPSEGSLVDGSMANMSEHPMAHAEVIVASLAAGLTNVGLLQMFHHQSEARTSFEDGSVSSGFHNGLQHNGTGAEYERVSRYVNGVTAHIIDKLTKTAGPEGEPLINSTAVVQVSCMGNIDHSANYSPFLLATNIPEFRTGFSNDNLNDGVTAKQIHATIAQGLGVPSAVYSNYHSNSAHDTTAANVLAR